MKNVCITKTSVMKVSTNHFARQEKLGIRAENCVGWKWQNVGGNTKKITTRTGTILVQIKS